MSKNIFRILPFLAAAALGFLSACAAGVKTQEASRAPEGMMRAAGGSTAVDARGFPTPPPDSAAALPGTGTAVLAGGCFWGVEGVFQRLSGVIDVVSGYSGGEASTATYESVGTGATGHAESVKILYDPSKIGYGTLLRVFFSIAHDPTELNYQGPDVGPQYRSAIFYSDDAQKRAAEAYIDLLNKAHAFDRPVVTEVAPLKAFYPAEDYHQNFMDNNPNYPYIVYWDAPKVRQLLDLYPELVAPEYK
jgi:peptide-methionine (S)-S-oxide reductase